MTKTGRTIVEIVTHVRPDGEVLHYDVTDSLGETVRIAGKMGPLGETRIPGVPPIIRRNVTVHKSL